MNKNPRPPVSETLLKAATHGTGNLDFKIVPTQNGIGFVSHDTPAELARYALSESSRHTREAREAGII